MSPPQTTPAQTPRRRRDVAGRRVDCDLHLPTPPVRDLFEYLPEYWIEHVENTLFKGPNVQYHPPHSVVARGGSGSKQAARSVEELEECHLDPRGIDAAITSCLYAVDSVHNPDAAVAMARALNDWQRAYWLRSPRLKGSIVVPLQVPALAIEEIERCSASSEFVQVLLPVRTEHPLGTRHYHPLWQAIERAGLVAGVHFGGAPVMPPTPTGWPSYFLEEYVATAQIFATQLTSLIVEGVFELCPTLRVTFLESGFTWLPAHLWRMDKEWTNLRRSIPWVRRPPSEIVREHVRLGVLPLDAPPRIEQLLEVVDQLGSDELLLWVSDYPHGHAHDPDADLLDHLDGEHRERIAHANATHHYRLDTVP